MATQTKERVIDKKIWLNSFKMFAKTILVVIFVFFYAISVLFFLAPKFDAKIFKFLGMKKAQEACYVQVYEKSNSNVDLYNLILFESELSNYEKELYYINLLTNDEKYVEFYQKMDKSAIENVDDKAVVAYLCNTNSYLINQKVKCMYNLGFDNGLNSTVYKYLKTQLEGDYLFESSFATYVDAVYNDESLTDAEKKTKMQSVHASLYLKFTTRKLAIETYLNRTDIKLVDKIIAQNVIVNMCRADYLANKMIGTNETSGLKILYEAELTEYNKLIK